MVATLAERGPTFGIGRVSLNFAMFREAFERGAELGAGPMARLWRQALLLASRNWQLESLYRSNAKYQPSWQPRFICFEYASDLPARRHRRRQRRGLPDDRPSLSMLLRRSGADEDGSWRTPTRQYADTVLALIPPAPDPMAEASTEVRLPEQVRVRRAKVDRMRAKGIDPYPVDLPAHPHAGPRSARQRGTLAARHLHRHAGSSVAGRVILKRDMGGLGFATLRDGTGDLQVMVDADRVSARAARSCGGTTSTSATSSA